MIEKKHVKKERDEVKGRTKYYKKLRLKNMAWNTTGYTAFYANGNGIKMKLTK